MSRDTTPLVPRAMLLTFVLVTSLFALWGFANDMTNPLVKAFKDIFVISNAQSSLVQTAFYGGYATMALPAALFIRRYSYKAGIIVGLALYGIGAMLTLPAAAAANFNLFLVSLYVLTFGLAFLETTANPYILSMGSPETATRRLNLAQSFNPIGSLSGMAIASLVILSSLSVEEFRADLGSYQKEEIAAIDPQLKKFLDTEGGRREEAGELPFTELSYDVALGDALKAYKNGEIKSYRDTTYEEMRNHDLSVIKTPYVIIGMIVFGMMLIFILTPMPKTGENQNNLKLGETFKMLLKNKRYLEGVVAQGFYVGAQIMCWTFIIHYATGNLGISAASAQNYNIIAMSIFCASRFICTFFLRYISPGKLLMILATVAAVLILGVIFIKGYFGLYCLIGVSACMSVMFPTIYGIALDGMGDEAKVASAGLIFAIVGGALMPPLQGSIIDMGGSSGLIGGLPSVSVSFILPLICFIVIAIFGMRTLKGNDRVSAS
ncbi:MAG: L-fucose:H+ symporter permease [Verrucomicrobiales bacterium]|nr:L-fucose:H+ symporter permease [Verrucomicrobiales bacterium]